MTLLSQRALNRALLARQSLLKRRAASAPELVEHLVGLQAQAPNVPYVALWTRLSRFKADTLSSLIVDRKVVRIAVMRSTIHLVTARDAPLLRRFVQPMLLPAMLSPFGKFLKGIDFDAVAALAREHVEKEPLTFAQLGERLNEQWPDRHPQAMSQLVRALVPLVQVPPRGLWGVGGAIAHTSLEKWLGTSMPPSVSVPEILLRYLTAFGPASVQDMQKWSGLTKLAPIVKELRPKLLSFIDESGRELFDVEDAPRPRADTPAPVRFLPEWDNVLLSHADRSRILAEDDRKRFFVSSNGILPGAILVDGFVSAAWNIVREKDRATLVIRPTRKLTKAEATAVEEEAEPFLAFAADRSATRRVELKRP